MAKRRTRKDAQSSLLLSDDRYARSDCQLIARAIRQGWVTGDRAVELQRKLAKAVKKSRPRIKVSAAVALVNIDQAKIPKE